MSMDILDRLRDLSAHGCHAASAHIAAEEITRLRSDLAAASARIADLERENGEAMDRLQEAVDIACAAGGETTRAEAERDAALERERMALWALALEGLRHPPEGWTRHGWGLRHTASGRGLSRGGGVTWLLDSDHVGHPSALAAILSIDPTAKPPPGWTP